MIHDDIGPADPESASGLGSKRLRSQKLDVVPIEIDVARDEVRAMNEVSCCRLPLHVFAESLEPAGRSCDHLVGGGRVGESAEPARGASSMALRTIAGRSAGSGRPRPGDEGDDVAVFLDGDRFRHALESDRFEMTEQSVNRGRPRCEWSSNETVEDLDWLPSRGAGVRLVPGTGDHSADTHNSFTPRV